MAQDHSSTAQAWRFPNRIAYVVNHSLPYSSDGYAVRTHEVAKALGALGHDIMVINRPGRPWSIEGFPAETRVAPSQTIDGVRYLFLPLAEQAENPANSLRTELRQAEKALMTAFEVFRPSAVVAVSNWETAEPALYAARRWGAAFFYEIRGFWEMSQAVVDPNYENTSAYTQARSMDTRLAQEAQAVFTLNGAMQSELAGRGISRDKIFLIPNGIAKPKAASPQPKLTRTSLGCQSKYLIGYVGSLSAYEGTDDLLEVLRLLRAQKVDVELLVVGSKAPKGLVDYAASQPEMDDFKAKAETAGLSAYVHMAGQVPQSQIAAYYGLLDAVVMPRKRTPVTELVPPLKPYSAAAFEVPVFMTDLPPLAEVAADIHGSLYPEGDLDALASQLRDTLENGGHPALLNPLPQRVFWHRRIQPLSRALRAVAEATPPAAALMGTAATDPRAATSPLETTEQATARFDTRRLPRVALGARVRHLPIAAIGPCTELSGDADITPLTRSNLLAHLATAPVGRFVIDWPGLQRQRAAQEDPGEWADLWSIENMRLNRLIMDATAIALDRGWQLQVIGPIARSRAPLFRTVSGAYDELNLDAGSDTSSLSSSSTEVTP